MPKSKKNGVDLLVFEDRERIRCHICSDRELKDWMGASLKATKDAGARKPSAAAVHRGSVGVFGSRMPRHENSTRAHLTEHEDYWIDWVEEADPVPG